MQASSHSQYDVGLLQQTGLAPSHPVSHPYVMRNNYWTSPAAVRQFPYYSKLSVIDLHPCSSLLCVYW